MSKLSLWCCPCTKSTLQIAWYLFGFYSIHAGFPLFWFFSEYQKTGIVSANYIYILLIPSLLLCLTNGLLIYGIKRRIGKITYLWVILSNVFIFGSTVGWMICTYPGYWTLLILFIWIQHLYASFMVWSGVREMDNDSSQNVSQAQPQINSDRY